MQKNSLVLTIVISLAVIIAIGSLGGGYYLYNKASNLKIKSDNTIITEIKGTGNFGSILFGNKSYELAYNTKPINEVSVISYFESGDKWEGQGYWDKRIFMQGGSSLAVNAENHVPALLTYSFENAKDFSNSQSIRYFINLSDYQVLESHALKLGDEKMENYYTYSVTNLRTGWNAVQIPINQMVKVGTLTDFNLSKINKLQLETIARPQNSLVANFDYLKMESNSSLSSEWQASDETFLSKGTFQNKIVFEGIRANGFNATLAAVPGLKDFVYEAKVSPQTINSSAGLFFRGSYKNSKGYYFITGGVNSNTWFLKKYADDGWTDIAKGEITNFNYETDKFYWLRVSTNGNEIKLYFSINGQDFTELSTVTDDSYLSGGVGAAVFGDYAYFDDFKVKK